MTVTVRFAPSPTGYLHVGNARVALINWLFAHRHDGKFILRLDDTDAERSTDEFALAIERDLQWLGLIWDAKFHQSHRLAEYAAAIEQLKAAGRLYPCYESPAELDAKRRLAAARHLPPIYDRAALNSSAIERAKFEAAGRVPHWRFLLEHERVEWRDLVRGPVAIAAASIGDPVLLREDGVPLYTFCSVVDDIDTNISHVIRGEDHVTNTAVQIQIFAALGATPPAFAHLALLTGAAGEGLSKRTGSASLADLRAGGIEAMAVNALLARLGSADPVEPATELGPLAARFDLSRFGRAPARFDADELAALNARVLHAMAFAQVEGRLPQGATAEFWLAVRGNIRRISDAAEWWSVINEPIQPVIDDQAFAAQAAELLPAGPFDQSSWGSWTKALAAASGRQGKLLFQPLRLALTGRDRGPEMHNLLPLIGPERARARLSGNIA